MPLERRWRLDRPIDLRLTLGLLHRSSGDPTMRFGLGGLWRAARTPDGVGTLHLAVQAGDLVSRAWGPGAQWLTGSVPELVGEHDDWSQLDLSAQPLLREVHRRHPGLRLPRTGLVLDALVPAVLEQRVTGSEAWRGWRSLVRRYGEPAPGPAEPRLWVMPDAERLRQVTSWDWHLFGVDARRYRTIQAAAAVAGRLEESVALDDGDAARRRLRVVPGVGEWTAAEVTLRALGDPDAVSVGDFHLKNLVGFALSGAARSDDATMLELLEPWRGQRARVIRLIELSGATPPKYGPRFSPDDIRAI
jgi:3-methyladenine DNA glycosylase/8-oxoguanine DNA glycosylase